MIFNTSIVQKSPEWWELKTGRVGGTRFSQVISNKKNRLLYELANERLDGVVFQEDEFQTEDMIFGTENEPIAIDLYEQRSGLKFIRGGVMVSESCPIHIASPDGTTESLTDMVEVKCTQHGYTQLQRYNEGVDSNYLPQIINYFAINNKLERVHWVSYCPFRPEIPIVAHIITRDMQLPYDRKSMEAGEIAKIGGQRLELLNNQISELINLIKF